MSNTSQIVGTVIRQALPFAMLEPEALIAIFAIDRLPKAIPDHRGAARRQLSPMRRAPLAAEAPAVAVASSPESRPRCDLGR